MASKLTAATLLSLITFIVHLSVAQETGIQQGVLFKKGTNTRISHAEILNKRTKAKVYSNDFGIFRIQASVADSLEISGPGYLTQKYVVTDFKDAIIFLQYSNLLDEVRIREKTVKQELEEARGEYRSKGVYYNGKPPIYLVIFKPLTFINELVGKGGKQARRFNKFADREIDYYTISARFNNYSIKNAVPIKDEEIEDFKTDYRPTAEQINRWNDYDLITYIRRSYKEFQAKKQLETIKN